MQAAYDPSRVIRWGVAMTLLVLFMAISVSLERSGVPQSVVAIGFALVPVAAVLVPSLRRRWPYCGAAVCYACVCVATIQTARGTNFSWPGTLALAVASGAAGFALIVATGVIARRLATTA